MDTAKDAAALLRPGDWCATIDLKDAYFHAPVNRRFRLFLRLGWRKKFYEFLVLPFGPTSRPSMRERFGLSSIWTISSL